MHVQSVHLENIKSFRDTTLDFTDEDGDLAGFHVIVGGNASGKSTILRAIALALAGTTAGMQLMKRTVGWITMTPVPRERPTTGTATLRLKPHEEDDQFRGGGGRTSRKAFEASVQWARNGEPRSDPAFTAGSGNANGTASVNRGPWNPDAPGWFAAGYGPMRRLTGSSPDAVRDAVGAGRVADFVTLFREDAALSESEAWLKSLQFKSLEGDAHSTRMLGGVREMMNDGLLPAGLTIKDVTSDGVTLAAPDGLVLPMRDISDGCRSAFALVLDILHRMQMAYAPEDVFEEVERAEGPRLVAARSGVVLVDEIESHLHPSWQRTLPDWLVAHFPNVQFIVTTHSPLIVQAATSGTIHALPLPGEEGRDVRKIEGVERDRLLMGRAHKVLLGSAFGLSDTRSDWALKQLDDYRRLEAKQAAGASLSTREKDLVKRVEEAVQLEFDLAEPGPQ